MPLFMDLHKLEGVTVEALVEAHMKDLDVQDKYGVRYLTVWMNEEAGKVFCLAEAPSAKAAVDVHVEAHGLAPDEIIEVQAQTVDALMGTMAERADVPEPAPPGSDDRFDNAFRTILFTDLESSVATTQRLGDDDYVQLLDKHDQLIRSALGLHSGREVKHTGDGIMACFVATSSAVACAVDIQRAFALHSEQHVEHPMRVRIGMSAGEPVNRQSDLFGSVVSLARRACDKAQPDQILVANVVRDLCIGKGFTFEDRGETSLKGFEEPVRLYEVLWNQY
jgi:class 3 adenylate cyclase